MVTVDESRYDESPAMRRAEYTHVGQVRQTGKEGTGKEGQVHLLTRIMPRKARVISIPEIASVPSA